MITIYWPRQGYVSQAMSVTDGHATEAFDGEYHCGRMSPNYPVPTIPTHVDLACGIIGLEINITSHKPRRRIHRIDPITL